MDIRIDPTSVVSNTGSWVAYSAEAADPAQGAAGGTLYGNVTKTRPVSSYAPFDLCAHASNGSLILGMNTPEYYPVDSCTLYCRYAMHNKNASGTTIASASNVRKLQIILRQNGTAVYTSSVYDVTSLTATDFSVSVPISSFNGWGNLTVELVASGTITGNDSAKRAIRVMLVQLLFVAATGASIATFPLSRPAEDVAATWLDSADLWGYNDYVFRPVEAGDAVTSYSRFGYKASGVFAQHPVYVCMNGIFVRVAKNILVQFYFATSFLIVDNVYTMTWLGDRVDYRVKQGDTILDVITFFRDVMRLMGYNSDANSTENSLIVEGYAGLLAEFSTTMISSRQRHPVLKFIRSFVATSEWSAVRSVSTEAC